MTENERIRSYYAYLLGVADDFAALPVPVTREDGHLYRRCAVRYSQTGNSPESEMLAGFHIIDNDSRQSYTCMLRVQNGRPVLVYDGAARGGNV